MKMYIAILSEFPTHMTPTLVAHSVLGAHLKFSKDPEYQAAYEDWLLNSFKKVTVLVSQTEFDRIAGLPGVYLGHENTSLEGKKSCAIVCPRAEYPKVLKYAKLWC